MTNFVGNVKCRDQSLLLPFVLFYDVPNWPPKLCNKFEVDTFSHCINIAVRYYSTQFAPDMEEEEGKTTNFWELRWPRATPSFSSGWDFMMGLGKPKPHTKFEVASFSRYRIIKGEPKNFRELP